MNIIIDRKHWKTAKYGTGRTCLLNEEGYQCCLGFMCEQLGIPRKRLLDCRTPGSLRTYVPHLYYTGHTELASMAMDINDNAAIDDNERERRLTELFATHGLIITFTGERT